MGKRIVILGAGFGGLATANTLRKNLDQDHKIIVIDKKRTFMMGLVNLWILAGTRKLEESQTPLDSLNNKGIEYLNDEITGISIKSKKVETKSLGSIEYDYLVIALGAELAPEKIDGFVNGGFNLYDSTQVPALRQKLLSLKKGKVAIAIMGMPYKCPPAPYEASMLINDLLVKNGTRDKVEIDLYAPSPIALPVAGPKVSQEAVDFIQQSGVKFHALHKLKSVKDGKLEFDNGVTKEYDILVGIPPHRVPNVIADNPDLTDGKDWISVDSYTLKTKFENVFAVGDVAEVKLPQRPLSLQAGPPMAVPKAGIFAEGQAKTVALQISDEINNKDKSAAKFDGRGYCFMEAGNKRAGIVQADFYNEKGPVINLETPSQESYEKKHDFERSRLREWLL